MLRRRILASAMASVMAIGSVAVVASAEDAAVATTNVKSKADLEAYVKSFEKFVADTIYDYGSISGEDFLDAYEYAENVLADLEADVYDYTVAYKMMETTYNKLVIHSVAELKTLIDSCKATYDKGNFYNEDLGDPIYKEDTFETFENAYEDAESVLSSSDSRVVTDAYETLQAAKDGLSKYDTVTKSEFRAALKAYETALQAEYKYDSWRRGTLNDGWLGMLNYDYDKDSPYWRYQGRTASYGLVYDYAKSFEGIIYKQYDIMDGIKQVNVTSQSDIVNAYKTCLDATTFLNTFKADDTDKATKASVKKLLNDYHSVLVHDYAKGNAEALAKAINVAVTPKLDASKKETIKVTLVGATAGSKYGTREVNLADAVGDELWYEDIVEVTAEPRKDDKTPAKKIAEAGIYVKSDVTYYIPVTKEGYWTGGAVLTNSAAKVTGVEYKTVTKKSTFNLTDVIEVVGSNSVLGKKVPGEVEEYANEQAAIDEVLAELTDATAARAASTTTVGDVAAEALDKANAVTVAATEAAEDKLETYLTTDAGFGVVVGTAVIKEGYKTDAAYTGASEEEKAITDGYMKKYADAYTNAAAAYDAILAGTAVSTKGRAGATDDVDVIKSQIAAIEAITAVLEDSMIHQDPNNGTFWKIADSIKYSNAWGMAKTAFLLDEDLNNVKAALNDSLSAAQDVAAIAAAGVEAADRLFWDATDNHRNNNVIDDAAEFEIGTDKVVYADLEDAMNLADFYLAQTKAADYKVATNPILDIANTGEITIDNVSGSSKEWTVVYRYLKYALTDKYGDVEGVHTKADIEALIEKSYELTELTGDAALFRPHHDALVDTRALALAWVKEANKDRTRYKDNVTPEYYNTTLVKQDDDTYKSVDNYYVADQVYGILEGAYNALNDDYNAFKYSFGEVSDLISEVAEMIDDGDLEATDSLVSALNEAAYRLSIVESIDGAINGGGTLDDDAFTSDRFFLAYNRVFTKGDEYTINGMKVIKPSENAFSKSHDNLKNAYEALKAEVTKQTEVTVLLGDVNGDGAVDQKDAAEILKAVVNGTVIEVAVGDFNADGAVDQRDAAAILKHVVGLA